MRFVESDMNKMVVEHYPVSRLPEELRAGLDASGTVRVTLEASPDTEAPRGPSRDEFLAQLKALGDDPARPIVTREEARTRIRELRDEWED